MEVTTKILTKKNRDMTFFNALIFSCLKLSGLEKSRQAGI